MSSQGLHKREARGSAKELGGQRPRIGSEKEIGKCYVADFEDGGEGRWLPGGSEQNNLYNFSPRRRCLPSELRIRRKYSTVLVSNLGQFVTQH